MEADKAFHEEYKVKKKRQLLPYAAWVREEILSSKINHMFVEEVMELVELKPLKNSILGLPRVNGHLTEQRKRLTISVELVALSLIFMDEPTSGMQRDAAIATKGVPDGHYPATWKLDVTNFSRKSKISFNFAQTFDNLRCREQDQ
ncbi:hypothetical protein Bca101_071521 [Brassica carinata]